MTILKVNLKNKKHQPIYKIFIKTLLEKDKFLLLFYL